MRAWALVLLAVLFGAQRGSAQGVYGSSTGEAGEAGARPLGEVLIAYANAARIDLIFDPLLVLRKRTRLTVQPDAPPETELPRLLDGTELAVRRLPSGTFVLIPHAPVPPIVVHAPVGTIRGVVVAEDGAPLPGVHLVVDAAPFAAASADDGTFRLGPLPPGPHRLRATHVGFAERAVDVRVAPGRSADVRLTLVPDVLVFAPLLKEDLRGQLRLRAATAVTNVEAVERVRGLGTPDAVRSLDGLPGVRVGEVLAHVHLQGSEPGEHQFRLDGVPIFEPVHLRGLVGAFNPFAIERVTVHKAGYGAEHGSFLAGVITAEHALPAGDAGRLDAQIDPLALNVLGAGRRALGRGREAQGMVAFRTSLWSVYPDGVAGPQRRLLRDWNTPDPFLLNASVIGLLSEFGDLFGGELLARVDSSRHVGFDPALGFRDLHAAGRLRLGPRQTLSASLYSGANHLSGNQVAVRTASEAAGPASSTARGTDEGAAPRDRYAWANTTAQLQHQLVLSPRALLAVRLRGSRYDLSHDYSGLEPGDSLGIPLPDGTPFSFRVVERVQPSDDGNRIAEGAVEARLDLQATERVALHLGGDLAGTRHRFLIEDANLTFGNENFRTIRNADASWRLGTFAEFRFDLTGRLSVTTGARTTYLPTRGRVYAEPRADVRYERLGRRSSLAAHLAGGLYRQYVNQFHVSSISPSALFPAVRFWLPVDSSVAPPKAYHLAGGVLWAPRRPLTLRAEAYYKRQVHQLAIDYEALWTRLRADTSGLPQASFLRSGDGHAYGVAVGADVRLRALELGVRGEYSQARRTRTLGVTADEGYEPLPWNEPFRLHAHAALRPADGLRLSLRWRSTWGRAWAFRQAYYDYIASDPQTTQKTFGPYDFLRPQDHRLRPLHQLDAGVSYERPLGPVRIEARADVLNVLDRRNEADWTMDVQKDTGGALTFEHVSRPLLPRLPSATLRILW